MDDSSVHSGDSQHKFKESLIAQYHNDVQKDEKGIAVVLKCMVTGCALPRNRCKAGHLLGKKRIEMGYKFKFDDIFDPKNGILWADKIEAAYGMKQVCLIYDFIQNRLHFKVLDPAIMDEIIVDDIKFKDVNGKLLAIASDDLPYRRLIWGHSSVAIQNAFDKKWINEADKNIYTNTLEVIGQHLELFQDETTKNSEEAIEKFKKSLATEHLPHPMLGLNDRLVSAIPFLNVRDEAAESLSAEDVPSGIQKKCSKCGEFKFKRDFSKSQWKKPMRELVHIFCVKCGPEMNSKVVKNQNCKINK